MPSNRRDDSNLKEETFIHANGEAQRQRNAAARALLQAWMADESGYEEEAWPLLKQALQSNKTRRRL